MMMMNRSMPFRKIEEEPSYQEAAAAMLEKAQTEKLPQHYEAKRFNDPSRLSLSLRRNARICIFLDKLIAAITKEIKMNEIAFLLFDGYGRQIRCHGNSRIIERLGKAGIVDGSLWAPEAMGPNAVTLGMSRKKTFVSAGTDNYLKDLQSFQLTYAWIDASDPQTGSCYGIALVTESSNGQSYQTLAEAICFSLSSSMTSNQTVHHLIDRTQKGVLIIDTSDGMKLISYINDKLREIASIPPDNYDYLPIEELVPRNETNRIFWKTIESGHPVADLELPIQILKKRINYIMSTEIYSNTKSKISGIRIYLNTRERASSKLTKQVGNRAFYHFEDIIGQSPAIMTAVNRAGKLAHTDSNVMLLGESGTGKELFAHSMHNLSSRRDGPFVSLNCGAIPKDLIASELFGYVEGAFTGAVKKGNYGKFELANHGTIFLDEIGELPLDMQATLLRAVEQKKIVRLGGGLPIDIDVKIISATNVDILGLVKRNQFRADLYYRLGGMRVNIPPLRDRGEDILLLADYFAQRTRKKAGNHRPVSFTRGAKECLLMLPWEGNVRELQNVIECAVFLLSGDVLTSSAILDNVMMTNELRHRFDGILFDDKTTSGPDQDLLRLQRDHLAADGSAVPAEDLSFENTFTVPVPPIYHAGDSIADKGFPDRNAYRKQNRAAESKGNETPDAPRRGRPREHSKEEILSALYAFEGNRSKAAQSLGISRKTFYRNLVYYGLVEPEKR